jgi:antitoxin YefM
MSQGLPLSEVKARFSEIVDAVSSTHERVTVTRNGRPAVVVVSADDLEAIEDTLSILSDPAAVRAIEEGRAAVAAGEVHTREELEALRDQLRARPA